MTELASEYIFVVKWRFACNAVLPETPQATGHRTDLMLDVLRARDPRPDEQVAQQLGRARLRCTTDNLVITRLACGRHRVRCRYCGAQVCTLLVVPAEEDQPPAVLLRDDEEVDVALEVLDVIR